MQKNDDVKVATIQVIGDARGWFAVVDDGDGSPVHVGPYATRGLTEERIAAIVSEAIRELLSQGLPVQVDERIDGSRVISIKRGHA